MNRFTMFWLSVLDWEREPERVTRLLSKQVNTNHCAIGINDLARSICRCDTAHHLLLHS